MASRNFSSDQILAKAVMAKIADGNIRAAVHIICSDDAPASDSPETLGALIDKHPPAPTDCHIPPRVTDGSVPTLQVDEGDVRRAITSFPLGSSGGPDSLLPQHLKDLTGSDGDPDLLCSLASFVNKLLEGTLPASIAKFLYSGTLTALNKKDGGIRPSTIEYVRNLVSLYGVIVVCLFLIFSHRAMRTLIYLSWFAILLMYIVFSVHMNSR